MIAVPGPGTVTHSFPVSRNTCESGPYEENSAGSEESGAGRRSEVERVVSRIGSKASPPTRVAVDWSFGIGWMTGPTAFPLTSGAGSVTCWMSVALLGAAVAVPLNAAVIVCAPADSDDVVNAA